MAGLVDGGVEGVRVLEGRAVDLDVLPAQGMPDVELVPDAGCSVFRQVVEVDGHVVDTLTLELLGDDLLEDPLLLRRVHRGPGVGDLLAHRPVPVAAGAAAAARCAAGGADPAAAALTPAVLVLRGVLLLLRLLFEQRRGGLERGALLAQQPRCTGAPVRAEALRVRGPRQIDSLARTSASSTPCRSSRRSPAACRRSAWASPCAVSMPMSPMASPFVPSRDRP